ncbi:unnamed protein product [Ambrosiozyma monospora]|uniref:Unnamed protein product n=1 Tax=Ambrosiozyma monospora TaxID=43982 RepID=A0ACB5TFS8_AMBMO|nr:unnamed protein product [Ambrosiozyma monospora]
MLRRQFRNVVLHNGEELNENTKAEMEELKKKEEAKKLEQQKQKEQEQQDGQGPAAPPKRRPIKKSGKENATQYAVKWIDNFLVLKKKYDLIVSQALEGNLGLSREIEAACAEFLNENNKVAEYLSLYIDDGIKKSFKDLTAEQIEEVMNNCIVILRFIKDKDIFEKYYKNHLARRLLQQKSISSDLEMNMITKFKQEIGSSCTSSFENMFTDIKLSQELANSFNTEISKDIGLKSLNHGRKLELDAQILTTSYWPMPINKSMDDVQFPPIMQLLKRKFGDYYAAKHNGRNLTWAPNMGTMDIRMSYPKKTYEVNMHTLSAIIILTCFSDESPKSEYTFTEIQELTHIPTNDLIRQLQSISVAPRTRLLKKKPMSKDISPDDVFSFNDSFKSPQTKVKVLTVSSSTKVENDQQRNETMDIINRSRVMETEAAIVRVMKARRTIRHQELVNER